MITLAVAGNEIGDEGIRMLSEALKNNSTLNALYLSCDGWATHRVMNNDIFVIDINNEHGQLIQFEQKELER